MESSEKLYLLLYGLVFLAVTVMIIHARSVKLARSGRPRAAMTLIERGPVVAGALILLVLGILALYALPGRDEPPAPRPLYLCRYDLHSAKDGICGVTEHGTFTEFRATPQDARLDGHEVRWAPPADGGACRTARQFVAPALEVAALELERDRPYHLADIAVTLSSGEAGRLLSACRAAQPMNNLLVMVVDAITLASTGVADADTNRRTAEHITDYLTGRYDLT